MDKTKELEQRIVELEKIVQALVNKNRKESMKSLGLSLSMRNSEGYERYLKEKYSVDNYKRLGWDEKFYELDFSKMLSEADAGKNKIDKLRIWKGHSTTIYDKLDVNFRYAPQWFPLTSFVVSAIEYYEKSLIEYVLEKGKYFDQGGRPADIYTKEVKETIIEFWESYKENPEYQHENGRYKGKPQKQRIYSKIADKIGIISNPIERESDRTKRIEQIIKNHIEQK
jgi:hypothetical protein